MGQHWAKSVRRRRRLERVILVVVVVAIPVVTAIQILSPSAGAAGRYNVRPVYYTVKSGDTLGKIANKFDKSVSYLASKNHIKNRNVIIQGSRMMVGMKKIVGRGSTSSSPKPSSKPASKSLPWSLQYHPERLKYDKYFNKWADANGIPRDLVKAVGFVESGWNNSAVSNVGAQGIGQLMPATAAWIRSELIGVKSLSVHNPEDNIRMSARYLRYLLKLSNGNQKIAIGSYYQGFGSIQRYGMGSDTKQYVAAVTAYRAYFK